MKAGNARRWLVAAAAAGLVLGSGTVWADQEQDEALAQNALEQWAQAWVDEMAQERLPETPSTAQDTLEQLGMDELGLGGLLSLSPGDFVRVVWEQVEEQLSQPVQVLGRLVGMMLLCALLQGLETAFLQRGLGQVFSVVCVLAAASFLVEPVAQCILDTTQALREGSVFLLSFTPLLGGVVAAGGHPVLAGGYNLLLVGACQVVSQLAADTLMPLLGIYLGLCLVAAAAPQLGLEGLAEGIRKAVCWGLGLATTVFVGLLSLQSVISTGADSLSLRASRFLVGSFVPVIGGALSDAAAAAQSCLGMLRGAVGSFGILIAAATVLPALIQTVVWYLIAAAGQQLAAVLGAREVGKALGGAAATLAVTLAVMLCFALLVVVSTTVVLMLCSGS